MPTYAYACTACDHNLEVRQSFTDDALTECPECTGRLRKVFSNVGVVFKGSGFYRTDSRADAKGSGAGKDAGSGAAKGSSDSSGGGDKAAAAPAAAAASSSSSSSSSTGSPAAKGAGPA